jgi:hypothetical protein
VTAYSFRTLDDLVLHLKGLVLVRALRERGGADPGELEMYGVEIDRVRERLANLVKDRRLRASCRLMSKLHTASERIEDGVVYHTYSRTAPDRFMLAP